MHRRRNNSELWLHEIFTDLKFSLRKVIYIMIIIQSVETIIKFVKKSTHGTNLVPLLSTRIIVS